MDSSKEEFLAVGRDMQGYTLRTSDKYRLATKETCVSTVPAAGEAGGGGGGRQRVKSSIMNWEYFDQLFLN